MSSRLSLKAPSLQVSKKAGPGRRGERCEAALDFFVVLFAPRIRSLKAAKGITAQRNGMRMNLAKQQTINEEEAELHNIYTSSGRSKRTRCALLIGPNKEEEAAAAAEVELTEVAGGSQGKVRAVSRM